MKLPSKILALLTAMVAPTVSLGGCEYGCQDSSCDVDFDYSTCQQEFGEYAKLMKECQIYGVKAINARIDECCKDAADKDACIEDYKQSSGCTVPPNNNPDPSEPQPTLYGPPE
ncbi:MAG: hypothetical protein J6A01_08440 [Proteobacteria bacterium]|nr:hypothetical protein [Pseudomonadota bacterium]